jgi:hypothetical protein
VPKLVAAVLLIMGAVNCYLSEIRGDGKIWWPIVVLKKMIYDAVFC